MISNSMVQSNFQMAASTDIGSVRKQNEDFFYFSRKHTFFIVCDGMGGHNSGSVASRIAGETLRDVLTQAVFIDVKKICEDIVDSLPFPAAQLIAGIRLANRRVFAHAQQNSEFRGMGTTLVAAVLRDGLLYVAHVGDSRVYRLRQDTLTSMTTDHTWINELLEDHEISESEAKNFRKKNVLTRALGIYPRVKVDLRIEPLCKEDRYLLCTDGLHNSLSDELIKSVLSADHGSIQQMADKLVQNAKRLNGSDNITGGVIEVKDLNGDVGRTVNMNRTIPEGSDKIDLSLDRALRTLYHQKKGAPKRRLGLGVGVGIFVVLLIAIIGFLLYRRSMAQRPSSGAQTSALVNGDLAFSNSRVLQPSISRTYSSGILVLVQAKNKIAVERLRRMNDVKVIDNVNAFSNRLPVYAGTFTWAIADTSRKLLYKNTRIRLISLHQWQNDENAANGNADAGANRNTPAMQDTVPKLERGMVFLFGQFSALKYRNATIYVNGIRMAPLADYLDRGFYLKAGTYTISIRDRSGKRLNEQKNVIIDDGAIVSLTF